MHMDQYRKKMRVPIIVTVLSVLYYAAYFGLLIAMLDGIWKYLLGLLPLAISALMIAVCRERIREIKGGEEDDLSQY